MPPEVANAPEDGSGGSRSPKGRAAAVTSAHVTDAPAHSERPGQSGAIQRNPWLRSTTMSRPTLPPAIPLPAPRGTSALPVAAAQLPAKTRHQQAAQQGVGRTPFETGFDLLIEFGTTQVGEFPGET